MDVLSVAVPALERISGLVRMTPRQSAWGPAEEDRYVWDGEVLGRVSATELPLWMLERQPSRFRADLGGWRTLHVEQEAQRRDENALRGHADALDVARILLTILASQEDWLVCCVRDMRRRHRSNPGTFPSESRPLLLQPSRSSHASGADVMVRAIAATSAHPSNVAAEENGSGLIADEPFPIRARWLRWLSST